MNKIITLFSMMLCASVIYAQSACDAEFSYGGITEFCTTGGTATVTHMTGQDGTYTYTGVGTLDINATTGEIDLAGSDAGSYDVTNTVTMTGESEDLIISGIMDGDLSGGVPKLIELYVISDIADLSIYGLGNASNGGISSAEEFNLSGMASAGDYIYITTTTSTDMMELMNYFPTTTFDPALLFIDNVSNNNGDDVVELYLNDVVIDVYGVEGVNGDNEVWDYTDSWAYRDMASAMCPTSTFTPAEWTFAGRGAIDGVTTNPADTEANHFPIGSYQSAGPCAGGNACSEAAMVSITISEGVAANAGGDRLGCGTNPIALSATGSGMWSGGNGSFDNPASANTNYNPNAFEVGTTVTLTYSVMDAVCGNSSDVISVTIFEESGDSEFFYSTAAVCPNGDPILAMHTTGVDGIYSYEVEADGPTLSLDPMTGTIDPATSDAGIYTVTNTINGGGQMTISGVADGTMTGGQPKAIEIFALADIPDLSIYGIGVAANNNGSNGENFTFPVGESASAGDHIYITASGSDFLSFFGFEADYVSGAISINGNDALELFENGNVIDVFGDVGQNPPNIAWNYEDGWALRNNNTGPDGGFNINNWTFGGVNSLEGGTNNSNANNPFPIGTFSSILDPVCPPSFTSVLITVGDNEAPVVDCPGGVFINLEPGECGEVLILPLPTAFDNCDGLTIMQTAGPADGDYVSLEDSPITVSFDITEGNGNVTVCEFDIVLTEFVPSSTSLTCNDNLNISLDDNCEALINADMILEGSNYGCYDHYTIETSFGSNLITAPGTYTVTVTDPETGNSCWSDIVVEDKFNATLICSICPPGAAVSGTLDCIYSCVDEDAILAGLIAVPGPDLTDNCGDANVSYADVVSDGTTCGSRVITRTYAVIASDGTVVSTCVSEYLLNPITTSSTQFSFPPAVVELPCGTGTDPDEVAAFFDNKIDTDADGLPDTPINPTNDIATGPNCPVDVIERHEGIAIGYVHYFETGCDGIPYAQPISNSVCMLNVTYTDQEIPACAPGCNGNVKVIRTWTVLDWCMPSAAPVTFTQVIKSVDTEAPTIAAEGLNVSVNPWNCLGDFSLPAPTLLHDNCTSNVTYTVSGPAGTTLLAPNTTANSSIFWVVIGAPKTMPGQPNIFTYTARDCCGNIANVDVEVYVYDVTPPIPVAKENIVVNLTTSGQLDENGNAIGVAKIFENSVNNGSYDGCSNVRIEIRREETSVACGYSGNSTYATNGDFPNAGSSNPTRADFDPDNGEYVKFCCDDITDVDPITGIEFGLVPVRMRVFDDGNMNGILGDWVDADNDGIRDQGEVDNYNETWVTVRVEGKAISSLVCPPDVTLACDMDYTDPSLIGTASTYALCGTEAVDVTFNPQLDACGVGFVIATYTVTGSSPVISCNQRIDIENPYPAFDPAGITYPRDLPTSATAQLACTDDITYAIPTWTAGVCDFIGFTEEVDTFFFEVDPATGIASDACFKILREFTVIDWCVYDATNGQDGLYYGSQVIKITDRDAPVLQNCEPAMFDVDADCQRTSTTLTNNAIDSGDCASDWLKWQVFVDTWGDGIVDYEYSSFLPTNDSNINNDTNGNGINDRYVAPTSSNEDVEIVIPELLESSMFNHLVTWKVTDGCGNVASCNTTFMVVDKKAPTPYCVSLSTAQMAIGSVELWAIDFDLGAFDNCTEQEDLRFTFDNVAPEDLPTTGTNRYIENLRSQARTFDTEGVISVDVYVWDEKGNHDFCTVDLTVIDNSDPNGLRGIVHTEENIGVTDVDIRLEANLAEYPLATTTDDSGWYAFDFVPDDTDYQIMGSKNDIATNGVSTLDLVLIQRHILDLAALPTPYKVIAADINGDNSVSAIDVVELRKVVLGVYSEFQSNTSWRFIDAAQNFDDITSPFPVDDIKNLANYQGDGGILQNFIAVKVGDVNATASYNLIGQDSEVRNGTTMLLEVSERAVKAGEQVEIGVSSADFNAVSGLQMTVEFNGLTFSDVSGRAISVGSNNVGVISDNVITMSWNSNTEVSATDELFVITAVATQDGNISEMIKVTDRVITPEVYVGSNLTIQNIELEIRGANGVALANELMQNEPNPFKQSTAISFNLVTAGNASLTIRDVTGKVIRTINGDYAAGMNTISIDKSDINTVGVLYYTIESGDFSETKKMIILE